MLDKREKQLEDQIKQLRRFLDKAEFYDNLTGLYNENTFLERVGCRFENAPEKKYAIVCLDVEKFNYINKRFGFEEGDKLLIYIGQKLLEKAKKHGLVVSRISSDIFAFLDEEKNIQPEQLEKEVQSWFENYPLDINVKISIGIYHVESYDLPVRLMCDRAKFAIDTIRDNCLVYVAEYSEKDREDLFMQHELLYESEKAFTNNEFKVYLQPKIDIRTETIVGAESLVRWEHPTRGIIFPMEFIPMFEENKLIARLDNYVIEETGRIIRSWIDKGYKPLPVSVNISRMDIYMPKLCQRFIDLTDKYKFNRDLIEIEITESAFAIDENQIIKIVDQFRELGFKVLMDDFGSGYSSLNMLKDINVDILKIDTRFLETGKKDVNKGKEIFETVVKMAQGLGFRTIIEGVETEEQKRTLLNLGCYIAQGFYYSHAIPEKEFEKLMEKS